MEFLYSFKLTCIVQIFIEKNNPQVDSCFLFMRITIKIKLFRDSFARLGF